MYKHQEQFLRVTQEYNRQIRRLLDMAENADRKQIKQFTLIWQELKSSLQKMLNQQGKFKQYINNPAMYQALLQPYIDFLEKTKAEIEKAGAKDELKH